MFAVCAAACSSVYTLTACGHQVCLWSEQAPALPRSPPAMLHLLSIRLRLTLVISAGASTILALLLLAPHRFCNAPKCTWIVPLSPTLLFAHQWGSRSATHACFRSPLVALSMGRGRACPTCTAPCDIVLPRRSASLILFLELLVDGGRTRYCVDSTSAGGLAPCCPPPSRRAHGIRSHPDKFSGAVYSLPSSELRPGAG